MSAMRDKLTIENVPKVSQKPASNPLENSTDAFTLQITSNCTASLDLSWPDLLWRLLKNLANKGFVLFSFSNYGVVRIRFCQFTPVFSDEWLRLLLEYVVILMVTCMLAMLAPVDVVD